MARDRAKHPPKAPSPPDDTPLPREPYLLLDGEVPLDEAASGRVPQPGPSRPDGSFDPHRGRGLWGNEHGPVTPTPADLAFDAEVGDEALTSEDEVSVQAGPLPEYRPADRENPLEDEARTQAQGLYYLTKALSWFKTLGDRSYAVEPKGRERKKKRDATEVE